MNLTEKSAVLDSTLRDLGSVLVAYSGGTDSAFLAFVAHRILGDRTLAVIADSASLPRAELAAALAFTAAHAIPTHILQTSELGKPQLPAQRPPALLPLQGRALHADGTDPRPSQIPPHRLRHEP